MNAQLSRALAKASIIPTLVLLASTPALAQVTFEGTSSAYFNGNPAQTSVGGLSFQPATFGAFDLISPGDFQNVLFGSFVLDRSKTYNYSNPETTFDLLIHFILPGFGDPQVDGRKITGNISENSGTLSFQKFLSGTQTLILGGATFELTVNSIGDIKKSESTSEVTGRITLLEAPPTSTVPEPFSMALLGTGLAGIGAARRRRRSNLA